MNDITAQRNCPSWCTDHHDPDEPDGGHFHNSTPETVAWEKYPDLRPARVQVSRSDELTGEQNLSIMFDAGDGLIEMSVSDAARLAAALATTIARATGD